MKSIAHKDLVVFDLDGTLAESKTMIDSEMAVLLNSLLETHHIAIITGGSHNQITKQFLVGLTAPDELLHKVHLFPTCGARCYQYNETGWQERYANHLTDEEKERIISAFARVFIAVEYQHPAELYGEVIEDRGTQITFSAIGQEAPADKKRLWNEQYNKLRLDMRNSLQELLPKFDVRVGGMTSIDVTKKGINKFYGIKKIEELLNIPIDRMVFVGDDLGPGGNDEPVKQSGIHTVAVQHPEETKNLLRMWTSA